MHVSNSCFLDYFNSGYLFQDLDFAYGITSLDYPTVFFPKN